MTSRSDRVTIRLTHRQMELLRALAYQFHNTPTSLASVYLITSMDHAVRRGAQLEKIDTATFEAEILRSLQVARDLGLAPSDDGEALPAQGA